MPPCRPMPRISRADPRRSRGSSAPRSRHDACLWCDWPMQANDQILVVGAGSLGRLTERRIGDRNSRRTVLGHLRLGREPLDARLGKPLLGNVGELENILSRHVVDEIYFASN